MTTLDFNDAGPQRSFDLMPAGTIVAVQMEVRPGGAGEGAWLKRSNDGGCELLDCEFTVVDGEFAKRKTWQMFVLTGSSEGHATAAEISRAFLRGALESARGVKSTDVSPEAYEKRKAEIADFNGLRFIARVSIEKSKDPAYADKNRLEALPADHKQWRAVAQLSASELAQMRSPDTTQGSGGGVGAPASANSAKPAQAIARPEWAQG